MKKGSASKVEEVLRGVETHVSPERLSGAQNRLRTGAKRSSVVRFKHAV